jgi:hypothetical protein
LIGPGVNMYSVHLIQNSCLGEHLSLCQSVIPAQMRGAAEDGAYPPRHGMWASTSVHFSRHQNDSLSKSASSIQNCNCNLTGSTIPWHKSISGPPRWTSNDFPSKDVSKSSTFNLMGIKWATVLLNRFKELIKKTWLRVSNGLHPFKYNYFFSAESNIARTQVSTKCIELLVWEQQKKLHSKTLKQHYEIDTVQSHHFAVKQLNYQVLATGVAQFWSQKCAPQSAKVGKYTSISLEHCFSQQSL